MKYIFEAPDDWDLKKCFIRDELYNEIGLKINSGK